MKQLAVSHMNRNNRSRSVTNHHDGDRGGGTGGGDDGTGHHDDDDDNDDSRMRHEKLLRVKAPLFRNQLGINK
jgi:hypothetical protein